MTPRMSGQKFHMLTVLYTVCGLRGNRRLTAVCRCDCGNITRVQVYHLTREGQRSCGCWQKQRSARAKANGIAKPRPRASGYLAKDTEKIIWRNMMSRCAKPNNPAYARYGGRGIGVCKEWQSFHQFLKDMGPRPPGHTLERKDNNLGYSADNCVWATYRSQNRNQRSNHLITYNGETLPVCDWAERFNMTRMTLVARINRGWSIERSMTEPVIKRSNVYVE